MKPQPLNAATIFVAFGVSMIWGGNLVALKLGMGTLPPLWSAFWRVIAGVGVVSFWAWTQGVSLKLKHRESGPILALGAMFAVQICFLNLGVDFTSPAYAVVLLNANPVFTNLFGHFASSEEDLNPRRLVGLALAFAGVCFVAMGTPDAGLAPRPGVGNVLMIASSALLAIRVIFTRRLIQDVHPLKPVVWQMGLSLPVFLVLAMVLEPPLLKPLGWVPVAAILYQGVAVAGLCFVVWTTLLRKHSASTLSMFGFGVPFFGVFLSAVIFGESLSANLLAGAALVTAGILIVTRRPKQAEGALNGAVDGTAEPVRSRL